MGVRGRTREWGAAALNRSSGAPLRKFHFALSSCRGIYALRLMGASPAGISRPMAAGRVYRYDQRGLETCKPRRRTQCARVWAAVGVWAVSNDTFQTGMAAFRKRTGGD
jgi:hypothetical protein